MIKYAFTLFLALLSAHLLGGQGWGVSAVAQTVDKERTHATITPTGTPRAYEGDALLETISEIGYGHARSMANTLCFDTDGQTIYFNSLFHNTFLPDELWFRGRVEGSKVVFDCEETVAELIYTDPDRSPDELKLGEVVFDAKGNPYTVKNMEFLRNGDRFYVVDTRNAPSRTFALYIDRGTDIEIYDWMYCPNLVPFDGHTDIVAPPADAQILDYAYQSLTWYGAKMNVQGHVAIAPAADGSGETDYYFDSLLPDIGFAWVKGTRRGNTITVPNDQYLGPGTGFYLYYNGWLVTGIDYENYQYTGEFRPINLSVAADGTIALLNGAKANPGAYRPDGSEYALSYETVMRPIHHEDNPVPAAPYDISVEYSEEYQSYVLDFLQDNLSAEGNYLDPARLGYYIYIDGQRYTFRRDKYLYLDRDELTLVPYGYNDIYSYDILCQGVMHELYIYELGFTTVGVQAVYTSADGTTALSTSPIVPAVIEGERPETIAPVAAEAPTAPATWFDLAGRRMLPHTKGISIGQGKRVIR